MKVGDWVEWESGAGGFWKKKRGIIVEVVERGWTPESPVRDPGFQRNEKSYVVKVGRTKLYWPRVRNLIKVPTPSKFGDWG